MVEAELRMGSGLVEGRFGLLEVWLRVVSGWLRVASGWFGLRFASGLLYMRSFLNEYCVNSPNADSDRIPKS